MPTIQRVYTGDTPTGLSLTSLTDPTGATPSGVSLPAAFAFVGGAWALTFAGSAAIYNFTYVVTWPDETTTTLSGTVTGDISGALPTAPSNSLNNLQLSAPGGQSLYVIARTLSAQDFNTSTSQTEAENLSNWTSYAISLVEIPAWSGVYFGTVPAALPAGVYLLSVYCRANASPASTDFAVSTDPYRHRPLVLALDWSGSSVNSIGPMGATTQGQLVSIPQQQNSLQAAQSILNQLYEARAGNIGITSITIDGQQVTYQGPAQLDQAILFWERKVALMTGRRRRVSPIRFDRF